MKKQDRIRIAFERPEFRVGQRVYVAQKNSPIETAVVGYEARVFCPGKRNLFGIISDYRIKQFVSVRKGDSIEITNNVADSYLFDDAKEAEGASEFLKVELGDYSWKRAIGDRSAKKGSPYSLKSCNLVPCCANISEVRDILSYCRANGGLMVSERDEIKELLDASHKFKNLNKIPLGKIFRQLKISL